MKEELLSVVIFDDQLLSSLGNPNQMRKALTSSVTKPEKKELPFPGLNEASSDTNSSTAWGR